MANVQRRRHLTPAHPHPDDQCGCAHPLASGTWYIGHEECKRCRTAIVVSRKEREAIEKMRAKIEAQEKEPRVGGLAYSNGKAG